MNIFRRAFYLGVGLVSLVGEKTTETLSELQSQTIKLAEELAQRGELTTEEARKFVDTVMEEAEGRGTKSIETPQPIEILEDESEDEEIQRLKNKVKKLQEELSNLQKPL